MWRVISAGVVLAGVLAPGAAAAQGLRVDITQPHAGVVVGPVVHLSAEVSDPALRHATLVVNGAAYDVPVEQGRIEQRVVAVPGQNRVAVRVTRGGRVARDSLTFRYDGPPVEMVVLLTWPSEGEIVDLWVREPGGETCKWDHRRTEHGGRLLDFSSDAIGFGSQAYVLGRARPGAFRLKLHYWGTFADDDRRGRYLHSDLIEELDRLEARIARAPAGPARRGLERRARRVRRRLDRWATPAAPQTPVRAEVILFPGSRFERRWRFDRVVQRTGQLVTLGEVEIDEAMIRAARQEER